MDLFCSRSQPSGAYLRREGACDGGSCREGEVQRSRPQLPDRQVGGGPPSSAQPQSQSTSGPDQLSCQLAALAPSGENGAAFLWRRHSRALWAHIPFVFFPFFFFSFVCLRRHNLSLCFVWSRVLYRPGWRGQVCCCVRETSLTLRPRNGRSSVGAKCGSPSPHRFALIPPVFWTVTLTPKSPL